MHKYGDVVVPSGRSAERAQPATYAETASWPSLRVEVLSRMRIHPPRRAVPGFVVAAFALAGAGVVSLGADGIRGGSRPAPTDSRVEAASLMARSLASIKALRLEKGLPIDPRARPQPDRHHRRRVHAADHLARRRRGEAHRRPTRRSPPSWSATSERAGPRPRRRRRGRRQRVVPGAPARDAVRGARARTSSRS